MGAVNYAGQVMFNWQASRATIKDRLAFIFNKEILSDVHFVVGKGNLQQRIPAHKFVLSVGSAVFDAMFNGAMATTSEEIELPDVEPAAFLALLRFLYSDEVQIGPETVMTTLVNWFEGLKIINILSFSSQNIFTINQCLNYNYICSTQPKNMRFRLWKRLALIF